MAITEDTIRSNTDLIDHIDPAEITPPIEIDDLQDKVGQEVEINGAIHRLRALNTVTFAVIRTIRDSIQAVFEGDNLNLITGLKEGDFVRIKGTVIANEKTYKGREIKPSSIEKISGPSEPLPIKLGAKELNQPLDEKLDERVLTLRHLKERAIFKVQEGIGRGFREFLTSQRFTEIHTPKLVGSNAEGGANVFDVNYFGGHASLAQSPQFYKQFMIPVFGRVFEVAPVFRAEKHRTSRHVNEYTSLDLEMGYIDSFRDVMTMEVACLKYIFELLETEYAHELQLLGVELPAFTSIPAVRFDKIKDIVAKKYNKPYEDRLDLEPEEERLIGQYAKEEMGSDFLFVTNYPWAKRPFYTMRSTDNHDYTEGFDLLFRGLEITTGGQRIHDHDMQVEAMNDKGLNPKDFEHFLKLHKRGTPPHGGLAIGLERLTMKLLGKENIRETTLFPRDTKRLMP